MTPRPKDDIPHTSHLRRVHRIAPQIRRPSSNKLFASDRCRRRHHTHQTRTFASGSSTKKVAYKRWPNISILGLSRLVAAQEVKRKRGNGRPSRERCVYEYCTQTRESDTPHFSKKVFRITFGGVQELLDMERDIPNGHKRPLLMIYGKKYTVKKIAVA